MEVFRITKYDKNWNRLGACSVKAADTSTPFRAGTVRCTDAQGKLYVRTCHEMYTSSDGLRHQSSCTFAIDMYNMNLVCTDAAIRLTGSYNNNYGYVSHSFNQFILVDGNTLLIADHGDAYPRAVSLMKYKNSTKTANFYSGKTTKVEVLPIRGNIGNNATGVSVGGFEYSSSNYLIAGTSISSTAQYYTEQRNVFVTATSKSNFSSSGTTVRWLTNFANGSGMDVSNVQLVKINDTSFFIAWTEDDLFRYTFLNASGTATAPIYTANAMLSDCKPIVSNNKIVWYVTEYSAPYFFVIDLNNKGTVEFIHDCNYSLNVTTEPTAESAGIVNVTCMICDETLDLTLPKLNTTDYIREIYDEPGCGEQGQYIYYWNNTTYGEICVYEWIPALEHTFGEWIIGYEASCGYESMRYQDCSNCSKRNVEYYTEEHEYGPWETYGNKQYRTCVECYYMETRDAIDGWYKENNKWYYYLDGIAVTGWKKISSVWYYFDATGVMQTGWVRVSGSWYYFDSYGTMMTGWNNISGSWFYLGTDGAMCTGWQKISGSWYYLDTSGVMQTGWKKISGSWYYLDSTGIMQTGWKKISGSWYYLDSSGIMQTGWEKIDGSWYYLDTSGIMQTGWKKISGSWYYLDTSGIMQTGWVRTGGNWYYMNSSGIMLTGTQVIDGVTYQLDSTGALID